MIGILGGGQLGRMLALAAAKLGLKCHVLSADPQSPAFDVVRRAMHKGVLMFAPVGFGGATVKISPPLVIPEDAIGEFLKECEQKTPPKYPYKHLL